MRTVYRRKEPGAGFIVGLVIGTVVLNILVWSAVVAAIVGVLKLTGVIG